MILSMPAPPPPAPATGGPVGQACTVVVFGASGDLTRRKLFPALYNLLLDGKLPPTTHIVGVARSPWDDATFASEMRAAVALYSRRPLDDALWAKLEGRMHFTDLDFNDAHDFARLEALLKSFEESDTASRTRLFYLAVPPSVAPAILTGLKHGDLVTRQAQIHARREGDQEPPVCRVVVEKPFGADLPSAKALNASLREVFDESQIFRIDHYLGKETVQNLLVFRFANNLFEPLWNREHIDNVQITVAEDIGVGTRGAFFEQTGLLRDVVQNHALQLLSLTAMEAPISLSADDVRDEKVRVLRCLRALDPSGVARNVVRGQYAAGGTKDGPSLPYVREANVSPKSEVETFVALRLFVDNWRWGGVPFYVRAGKRMPHRVTEIALQFKRLPHRLFSTPDGGIAPNVLAIRIQPDEQIALRFYTKEPGSKTVLRNMAMEFEYGSAFGGNTPEAYERLLLDALRGDATLFTRDDEVEQQWRFVDRIREAWKAYEGSPPPHYDAGTWGPEAADELITRDGRSWRRP